ncbi:hypothetical protein Bca4012_103854 [Brassica carinata]
MGVGNVRECLVQHDDAWVEVRWPDCLRDFSATFPRLFPWTILPLKSNFRALCGLGLVSSAFQLLFDYISRVVGKIDVSGGNERGAMSGD